MGLAAASTAALLPIAAHAQTSASAGAPIEAAPAVEEVVITARQRSESVQEVPISASVVNGAALEAVSVTSLAQLGDTIPSLNFRGNGTRLNTYTGMRGVGDYARNPGIDNRVGIYVDGVFAGRSDVSNYPLFDVDHVEILRGPQGTLFGKDTMVGAISVTSVKPGPDASAHGAFSLGSRNFLSGSGVLNQPLSDDLFARLSIFASGRKGFVRNRFDNSWLGGGSEGGGRLQLRYVGLSDTTVDLSVDAVHSEQKVQLQKPLGGPGFTAAPGDYEVAYNTAPTRSRDIFGVSATVDHSLAEGFALTSISAYRETSSTFQGNSNNLSPVNASRSDFADQTQAFTQELRLTSPEDRRLSYVAGLYLYYQSPSSHWRGVNGPEFPVPLLRNAALDVRADVKAYTAAAYAHGTLKLTDDLNLDAGVRIGWTEKKLVFNQSGGASQGFPDIADDRQRIEDSAVLPMASLRWRAAEGINAYFTYSEGQRAGGWNADFVRTRRLEFEPETARSYEAGLKTEWFDRRLRVNFDVYRMRLRDFQVQQLLFDPAIQFNVGVITNAGAARSQGAELEFALEPVSGLSISGGVGYNEAKYTAFADGGGPGVDYTGNSLINAPRWDGGLQATYVHALSDDHSLKVSANYSYRSKSWSNASNAPIYEQPGYGMLGARIALDATKAGWELALVGRNLGDKKAILESSVVPVGGYRGVVYAEPRFVGLELKLER